MNVTEMKRMAVDAMVKYVNDDEIYELAKALEDAAERLESFEADASTQTMFPWAEKGAA